MTGPDRDEERLVERLAAEGLISRTASWRRGPIFSAAMLAIMVCAFWLGGHTPSLGGLAPATGQRYILLLYEGPGFRPAVRGHDPDRAAEYGAWARTRHADGDVLAGEELKASSTNLGAAPSPPVQPAGFFVIRARDQAAALRLARSCPHLRHGGSIAVRAVAG